MTLIGNPSSPPCSIDFIRIKLGHAPRNGPSQRSRSRDRQGLCGGRPGVVPLKIFEHSTDDGRNRSSGRREINLRERALDDLGQLWESPEPTVLP